MRKMLTALAGAALVVTLATPAGAAMSEPQRSPGVTHAGSGSVAGDHGHWGHGGDRWGHGDWGHDDWGHDGRGHDGWGHRGDWDHRGGDHRHDRFPRGYPGCCGH